MKIDFFKEDHVLEELKHYLPSQTPLKDFIHHNSLHAFQDQTFFDGIFNASAIFGYHVTLELNEYRNLFKQGRINKQILEKTIIEYKGNANIQEWTDKLLTGTYDEHKEARIGIFRAYWKKCYNIDLNNKVQPLLFRVLCAYLDQGIAVSNFPVSEKGFLATLRLMEKNSFTSFFKSTRVKELFFNEAIQLKDLLSLLVGKEELFERYLFDQQFSHRGWSGMVATLETRPDSLFERRAINLRDLIHFELLLEMDALDRQFGQKWEPLGERSLPAFEEIFSEVKRSELQEVLMLFQDAFEWSYYDEVLGALLAEYKTANDERPNPSFQAVFCIDERECSLRRHLESTDKHCETFGAPGFFGVEFFFQPENGQFYEKLCPAPVTPGYLIKETNKKEKRKHDLLYEKHAHTLLGGLVYSLLAGWFSLVQLVLNLFRPKMSPAISDAFAHMGPASVLSIENTGADQRENGLQIGFTIEEMAQRVEAQLRNIGLIKNFAPLVYMVAHGSSSANNPHHGAHDCGACSGRPGSVNAKVFAFMANHKSVREILATKGIDIPESSFFVGALHDTAADEIGFFGLESLPESLLLQHKQNHIHFEEALDLNAQERSRRFASIDSKAPIKKIRNEIRKRSVSLFEPRPELGHGSNAMCIIGRRDISKNLFLDRRAFLNSYDYATDPTGQLLTNVIRPIGPVCGGINLEYYFSRIDNHKLGAGTKLPHNVMGLIGVSNSSDGDLRPGLPVQMIEVHDPVRLLVIVEQDPAIVLQTIQTSADMYQWYINEWVHLMVLNPADNHLYRFLKGAFTRFNPLSGKAPLLGNADELIHLGKEMQSFTIEDATQENLPVYALK